MTKRQTKPASSKAPAQQNGAPNPWGAEAPEVDRELYTQQRQSYPPVTWLSKYVEGEENRYWIVKQESVSDFPGPFWTETNIRFGKPTDPLVPVYKTEVMRFCPIGFRGRLNVEVGEGSSKREYHFPMFTSKDNRPAGKASLHYQVIGITPNLGIEEPVVLGLRGLTRTISWDHNGSTFNDFPIGVVQKVMKYIDNAPSPWNEMPLYCSWWMDLRGAITNDGPYYVGLRGGETYVQPFTADMRTKSNAAPGSVGYEALPDSRYVGTDLFYRLQDFRKSTVLDWEAEWAKFDNSAQKSGSGDDDDDDSEDGGNGWTPGSSGADEEDEIPF